MLQIAPSFSTVIIELHWAMLILRAAVYVAIEPREYFPRHSDIREGFNALALHPGWENHALRRMLPSRQSAL